MPKPLSDKVKSQIIEWYLEEDERTLLDVKFEFSVSYPAAAKIIKEAGVGKSQTRNKTKNIPASDGRLNPSDQPNIRTVSKKAQYRGHRRRSQL